MPVEGGRRVAIIEGAERMNEDAQSALLKTLEEPPAGVTIVLCADGEARLLPTVRSRCARVRLGLVGPRDIEAILGDQGLADPPTASRLARIAGGRPGLALAYARAPEAVLIRAELTRLLLDFTDAAALGSARRGSCRGSPRDGARRRARTGTERFAGRSSVTPPRNGRDEGRAQSASAPATPSAIRRRPPSRSTAIRRPARRTTRSVREPCPRTERRRAVERLLGLWLDVARDVVLVRADGSRSVRDTVLLEELASTAAAIAPGAAEAFLASGSRAPPSCSKRTSRRS